MRKDYEKFFPRLAPPEPPVGLFQKIMARIHEEERLLSIKRRLILFSATVVVSAGAFIATIGVFQQEFAQSGFSYFSSLLFSDLGSVIANWQDFGLTLLESLPAMSMIALLAVALIFFWSIKNLALTIQKLNIKV